jgi:hypothetical protein
VLVSGVGKLYHMPDVPQSVPGNYPAAAPAAAAPAAYASSALGYYSGAQHAQHQAFGAADSRLSSAVSTHNHSHSLTHPQSLTHNHSLAHSLITHSPTHNHSHSLTSVETASLLALAGRGQARGW